MKQSLLLPGLLAIASALPLALLADEEAHRRQQYLRQLDPSSEEISEPRSQLLVGVSGSYIFDLGSDAKNQKGWGGSFSLMALPTRDPEYPDWQLMFGGEFYGFSTTGDEWRNGIKYQESIDSGLIYLNLGIMYSPTSWMDVGLIVGPGTGGSYGETKDSGGGKKREGNWNYALQIKPTVAFHLSENASLYANYRFSYIGPMYQTDLIGYDTVTMLHQSVEIGFAWRF